MKILRFTILLITLLASLATSTFADEKAPVRATFKVVEIDPMLDATIATSDRLYLRISYESPGPIRFLPEAYRQGEVQQGAFANSTPPYDRGQGEALAWVGFARPIRIDEIRITAYDMEWQPLATVSTRSVATWESQENGQPREPAEWVGPLLKHHRQIFDNAFDPQPEKPEPLFDIFFLFSFMALPLYLLMQAQMLIRYRGRWQWYASAPLLPMVPLGLYTALGLGLSTSLWIIFLFRYTTVALLYLLIVWAIRRRYNRPVEAPQEPSRLGAE